MTLRRPLAALSFLAVCLGSFAAGVAGAATPGEVTTFKPASRCGYGADTVAAAPEGVLALTCQGLTTKGGTTSVVNLLPSGEVLTRARLRAFEGPLLTGPAGEIWVGVGPPQWAGSHWAAAFDRIAADGSVQKFPVHAAGAKLGARPHFAGLVLGAEGAVWAALGEGLPHLPGATYGSIGGALVRIAADSRQKGFRTPRGIEPTALASGPDGNLWFTAVRGMFESEHVHSPGTDLIGRMTPTGQFTFFRIPGKGGEPDAIAAGPDGRLWFVGERNGVVGTIGTDGSFGRRYPIHPDNLDGRDRVRPGRRRLDRRRQVDRPPHADRRADQVPGRSARRGRHVRRRHLGEWRKSDHPRGPRRSLSGRMNYCGIAIVNDLPAETIGGRWLVERAGISAAGAIGPELVS